MRQHLNLRLSTVAMLALLAIGQPAATRGNPTEAPVIKRALRRAERNKYKPHQGARETARRAKRIEAGRKP